MQQSSRLAAVCLVTVLASALVSYAVSAAAPQGMLMSGTTRYAYAHAEDVLAKTTTSSTYSDMPGLSASITVPAGKVGDVIVVWCGMVASDSAMMVRALIGGSVGKPDNMQVRIQHAEVGAETTCATFYRGSIPAGTRTVKMQWAAHMLYPSTQQRMFNRSMLVILNLH